MTNRAPRKPTLLLATISALLILGVVVPTTAAGQTLPGCDVVAPATLSLGPSDSEPIEPGTTHTLTVDYEYRVNEFAWSIEPIAIEFDVSGAPGWADVVLSDTTVYKEVDPAGETAMSGTILLYLSVANDAPAYERAIFHLDAEANEGTCVAPAHVSADLEITPGFHEDWGAQIDPDPVHVAVGDVADFEAIITNLGNGAIGLSFQAKEDPENGELYLPDGYSEVGSEAQGDVNLRKLPLQYEATSPGKETITFLLAGYSPDNPEVTLEPQEVTFTVQSSHFEEITEELPAPILPIVLIALGLVLLHAHRRR